MRKEPVPFEVETLVLDFDADRRALLYPVLDTVRDAMPDGYRLGVYNGMLGWFWAACVVTTNVLVVVTRLALKERYYSAVMAATGLLYLAILTAFGMDLVARAILSMA